MVAGIRHTTGSYPSALLTILLAHSFMHGKNGSSPWAAIFQPLSPPLIFIYIYIYIYICNICLGFRVRGLGFRVSRFPLLT